MSNSPLVDFTQLSPNNSGERDHTIDRITPHCYCGQVTVERMGAGFAKESTQASANYGIGTDGKVGLFVPENMRSWCSSDRPNDERAVTIECASDPYEPCNFNSAVYAKLVTLCVDICSRNGKNCLLWIPDRETALAYEPTKNEMVLTVHRWFSSVRSCPGEWMMNHMQNLADTVTSQLSDVIYRVQVGAFRNKTYAMNYLQKVKDAGFPNAYITTKG